MKIKFRAVQVFTPVLLAVAIFAVVPGACADMTSELKAAQGNEFDHHFLSMMIHHHKMAIEMSELASSNGKSLELKQMAKKIISDQREEISKMESMLKETGKPAMKMSHDDPMMKDSMSEMEELKKSKGEEFDSKFATAMSKHHQMAIEMSELAESRAQMAGVKAMAGEIIKKQRKETEELAKFKK